MCVCVYPYLRVCMCVCVFAYVYAYAYTPPPYQVGSFVYRTYAAGIFGNKDLNDLAVAKLILAKTSFTVSTD